MLLKRRRATTSSGLVRFRRRGIRVGEVYFQDRRPERPGVDLLRVLAVPRTHAAASPRTSHTAVVDLRSPEDELLAAMSKTTRYEIRRAESKDGVEAQAFDGPTPELTRSFCDHYDDFAASKSLAPVFRPRLEAMAAVGQLTLTLASVGGEPLVWHAYAFGGDRALLLYSASLFRAHEDVALRATIGRANRCLHWHDMQHFKRAGCVEYDFGGIDVTGRDEATSRIADFKRGFGGVVRPTYAWSTPLTLRGRLVQAALLALGVDF